MKQLKEKVAIVTGAGQGIGKGIALCLAKRGVKVIATGRRAEPIEQTIAEIKELGGEGFAMTCDSADRARVEEVVKAAAEKYGTVDVVVNNAQAIVPSAPVEETSYDNMLKAWQSGVIGSLNYMQAAFPYMKEQHEGRIINFASATGMFGIAGQLAYGSNKEALRGMTLQKNGDSMEFVSISFFQERNHQQLRHGLRNFQRNMRSRLTLIL